MWISVVAMVGCGDSGGGAGGTGGEPPLLDEYVLSDDMLVPESGTYDSENNAFYVGSATEGVITRVAGADGAEEVIFTPPADEEWRTLGVIADTPTRTMWVCAQLQEEGVVTTQEIWRFDLTTDALDASIDIAEGTGEAGSSCNDIAVDGEGFAYVSDSANPRVYRVNPADDSISVWADDPLLAGSGGLFGLNGIAVTDDDEWVIVSKTTAPATSPRMLRIEIADPTQVIEVVNELEGTADGISFLNGDLYISQVTDARIARLVSTDGWQTTTVSTVPAPNGTSTVRPAEGRLYGIYSDITAELLGQPVRPPFLIYRVDLNGF